MLRVPSFIVAAVLAALLHISPLSNYPPEQDSGVFLYVADLILHGGMPYRDVWDHKPPAIYFIDALGLLLGFGSVWGVWLLEVASLSAAALLCYTLLRPLVGVRAATVGVAVLLGNTVLLVRSGNYTEEFGLPLQMAALLIAVRWGFGETGGKRQTLAPLAVGACVGLLVLLKPNLIGTGLIIGAALLLDALAQGRRAENRRYAAWMLAGCVAPIAVASAYIACGSAWLDMWDQVFAYNFSYASTSLGGRLDALVTGLRYLSFTGSTFIAVLGWAWCARTVRKAPSRTMWALQLLVLVGVPVELFLSVTSGRAYPHYYLALVPQCAIAAGLFYSVVERQITSRRDSAPRSPLIKAVASPRIAALLFLSISLAIPAQIALAPLTASASHDAVTADWESNRTARMQVVGYITSHTSPGEKVLVWGAESGVNVASHRLSPTRFIYQLPLFTESSAGGPALLLSDLQRNPPALIVDASESVYDRPVPPIDAGARATWASEGQGHTVPPGMQAVLDYMGSHYGPADPVCPHCWPIFVPHISFVPSVVGKAEQP
jgi:hypothetical protein